MTVAGLLFALAAALVVTTTPDHLPLSPHTEGPLT